VVTNFFDNDAHIYVTNFYEEVMSELCKLNVLNVCCDKHEDSLPYLIYNMYIFVFTQSLSDFETYICLVIERK
jgi:hypothetical protein